MARGGSPRLFSGRRGMSPLIATILLMAFAVALGGMITNWNVDISISNECDNIKIDIAELCTSPSGLYLQGKASSESVALQGLKLLVSTPSLEQEVNVKGASIEPGKSVQLNVDFSLPRDATLDLIGVIGSEANPYTCEEPFAHVEDVQPCT